MPIAIALDRARIAVFCEAHHIRKLVLFGSLLRPEFRTESDVDVLVEFEPGHVPDLAFFAMQDELSRILGRRVDLNTLGFLSSDFRRQVLTEAQILYAKG